MTSHGSFRSRHHWHDIQAADLWHRGSCARAMAICGSFLFWHPLGVRHDMGLHRTTHVSAASATSSVDIHDQQVVGPRVVYL